MHRQVVQLGGSAGHAGDVLEVTVNVNDGAVVRAEAVLLALRRPVQQQDAGVERCTRLGQNLTLPPFSVQRGNEARKAPNYFELGTGRTRRQRELLNLKLSEIFPHHGGTGLFIGPVVEGTIQPCGLNRRLVGVLPINRNRNSNRK